MGTGITENSTGVLQKINNRTSLGLSNPISEFTFKEKEISTWKRYLSPKFTAASFVIGKIREQPKCPSVDGRARGRGAYVRITEYHSAFRKEEILPSTTTWKSLAGIKVSESARQRKTDAAWLSLIRGNLKKRQTHRNRIEWWFPAPQRWGSRERLVRAHKLPGMRGIGAERLTDSMVTTPNTV